MLKQTIKLSFIFCLLWFAATYTYNLGLSLTFESTSFVLSNTSSVFVYLLSLILRRDKLAWISSIGVLIAFGGIICVYFGEVRQGNSESSSHEDKSLSERILGDALNLVSAIFYALYSLFLESQVEKWEEKFGKNTFSISLFLGWVGAINIVALFGVFFIFHYTGFERFSWPPGLTFLYICCNAFIGTFVSDYCWAQSVVRLGPLTTTLGLSLTIPLGMVTDSTYQNISFGWLFYVGTVCVVTGFVMVTLYKHRQRGKANNKSPEIKALI